MKRPRILFVAMTGSVHTARWIAQLNGLGWDLHVFPVDDAPSHSALRGVTVHDRWGGRAERWSDREFPWPVGVRGGVRVRDEFRRIVLPWRERAWRLARLIEHLRPDVVHSLEIQQAGYLTLTAHDLGVAQFPPWMVTNWGSDISLFGRLKDHTRRIQRVMESCQFYTCECRRDVTLARVFGFQGQVLPVVPISGGFPVSEMQSKYVQLPVSSRRLILLKGYQHWAGRALSGIKALEQCASQLKGYQIGIHGGGTPDVRIAAELLANNARLSVEVYRYLSHDDMLRLYGRARTAIGLSISDGISHGFMEAIIMGAFPIQSYTACVDEWAEDGRTGCFVDPEDPYAIAKAIIRSVTDDALVDRAAEINMRTARERLDHSVVKPQVIGMYERALGKTRGMKPET
jgi:glycosyltransferase involved in cell wall biosynthesis